MTRSWIDNGPVALPSRTLAYGAGLLVLVFAVAGGGLGFQAAFRRAAVPGPGATAGLKAGDDDALIARPIVDLAPPSAPPPEQKASDDDDAKADALAAQTAAAQAIQAKASAGGGNIDDVLASPTEKPPAPAKTAADEAPPGTPVKSDVPF